MTTAPHLFCFGFGFTARALAPRLLAQGWRVSGTGRSARSLARIREAGARAHVFDRAHPLANLAAALDGVTHVLSSVPPDEAGDPVLDCHGAELAKAGPLRWIGYLSTTGVYGDRDGALVDEDSPLNPTGERGRRRLDAEAGWLRLHRQAGLAVHVFRLAGIYGPGRNAFTRLRAGEAQRIRKPGQIFSRIHVADIVTVLIASMARPHPGRVYNLADDAPAPQSDVITYAAELMGIDPPPEVPFEEADLSHMARSFYQDSKRVSNARIKAELGIALAYPDYRTGLKALFEAGEAGEAGGAR